MRTIRFRGKSLKGDWVIGDLHLLCQHPHIHTAYLCSEPIDSETVGQYTGLKDWNGKEVYEGDIICLGGDVRVYVAWHSFLAQFYLAFPDDPAQSGSDEKATLLEMKKQNKFEVIGNIHDNPELLNGEEDRR